MSGHWLYFSPQNMIAQSQSGTGKTAAFVLTMLSRVVTENKWPQCLCLAPTYELAMQIGEVVSTMSQYMPDVRIRYALRGERSKSAFIFCCTHFFPLPFFSSGRLPTGRSF